MLTTTKRTATILGVSAALAFSGGAVAFAQAMFTGSPDAQPEGPTYLCVDNKGTTKYVQFRRGDDGAVPKCNPGLHQWTVGAQGEAGPPGENGVDGENGADGTNGVSGYEVLAPEQRYTTGSHVMTMPCPSGKSVIGGGYGISAQRGEGGTTVEASQVDPASLTQNEDGTWTGTAWQVQFTVHGSSANMKTTATCAATS